MNIIVLMSTYNGEKYLEEQINSILNQKGDFKLDLLVRDDGSSDRTKEILQKYADEGKLKWYTGNNLGPGHSFLDLIKQSPEYDFYAFADQDDFWMENKIELAIKKIKNEEEAALYCSNAELVDSKLNNLGRNVYNEIPKTDFYTVICAGGLLGCTMVFNSKLAKHVKNSEMSKNIVLHDFYLASLCVSLNGKIFYEDIVTLKYRQHGNNVVGVSHGVIAKAKDRIKDIITPPKISIAEQTEEIIRIYKKEINEDKLDWLIFISEYKKSLHNRIKLSLSRKTKYININMGMKLRLSILFGNR